MKLAHVFVLFSALMLTACFSTAPPPRIEAPIVEVFRQARNGNWTVRVYTDSVAEGRVNFIGKAAVHVGGHVVRFDQISTVERSHQTTLGSKRDGFIVGAGAGALLGYLGGRFAHEMGGTRGFCTGCVVGVLFVGGLFGTFGALVGMAVDPPEREWATIWQR